MKIVSITLGTPIRAGSSICQSFEVEKHEIVIEGNFVFIYDKDKKKQFATTIFNLRDIHFDGKKESEASKAIPGTQKKN